MRRIERYALDDGRFVDIDKRDIEIYGLWPMLERCGIARPSGRVPVIQSGVMVGTVDATFDPDHVRSMSKMYTTRPGDFVRGEKCFIASPSLGYGDLIAVLEFANA